MKKPAAVYNILIDGKLYRAVYWGRDGLFSRGWIINTPKYQWFFDATRIDMQRKVLQSFPGARFFRVE